MSSLEREREFNQGEENLISYLHNIIIFALELNEMSILPSPHQVRSCAVQRFSCHRESHVFSSCIYWKLISDIVRPICDHYCSLVAIEIESVLNY